MNKTRKIFAIVTQLTLTQWIILLVSVLMSPFITLSLKFLGFKRTINTIKKLVPVDKNNLKSLTYETLQEAHSIAYTVKLITNHSVVKSSCLCQSLLCYFWLNLKNIPSKIIIGVSTINNIKFGAHAWVEYDNQPLNESLLEVKEHSILYENCQ